MLRSINKMNEPIERQKEARKNYMESQKRQSVVHISWFNEDVFCKWLFFSSFHHSEIERFHFELRSWYLDYWIWCAIIKIDSVSIRKLPFLKLLLNKCELMYTFISIALEMFSYFDLDDFLESGTWCKCWIIPLESGLNSIIEFLYI